QRGEVNSLFGGVQDGYRGRGKLRQRSDALGAIDQTGTSQQRSEILDLTVMVENLVVECREEFSETHVLFRRDLLQRIPKRHFQTDRGAVATDPQRSGQRFIVALRLAREQMAHGFPPGRSS